MLEKLSLALRLAAEAKDIIDFAKELGYSVLDYKPSKQVDSESEYITLGYSCFMNKNPKVDCGGSKEVLKIHIRVSGHHQPVEYRKNDVGRWLYVCDECKKDPIVGKIYLSLAQAKVYLRRPFTIPVRKKGVLSPKEKVVLDKENARRHAARKLIEKAAFVINQLEHSSNQ